MSRLDRVKPVRSYRVAKYPSHADPDPTTYPAPVEFPFRREFVRAVAGVGVAAALLGCGGQDDPEAQKSAAPAAPQEKPKFENPKNPFTIASSGLPHRTSPYGTGQPSYLSDELARELIEKIFKDEGFSLDHQTLYSRDGVSFRAAGLEPRRGIGYVYANGSSLDEDGIVSWMRQDGEAGLVPEAKDAARVRVWIASKQWQINRLPKVIKDEAARISALSDGPELMEAYKKLYRAFHEELLSLEEMKFLEQEAPKKKQFIAVISQLSPRYLLLDSHLDHPEVKTLYEQAEKETDLKARDQIYRKAAKLVAASTLKTLERDVREFIAWARSQGLQ
jgi:hypothetical protein